MGLSIITTQNFLTNIIILIPNTFDTTYFLCIEMRIFFTIEEIFKINSKQTILKHPLSFTKENSQPIRFIHIVSFSSEEN